jgi:lipoprotein-releasing system ATP-binding protein
VLSLTDLVKEYPTPTGPHRVLDGIDLVLDIGDAVVVSGPAGSGRSTLLAVAGGLEAPTSGQVLFDGTDPYALDPDARAGFRNREVGFVSPDHGLLPQLTVLENVLVPTLAGDRDPDARDRACVLLTAVGLEARASHRPARLSRDERLRAAIARALVRSPRLLLCDEPTADLDRPAADTVADLLLRLQARHHTMLLVTSDDAALASRFSRRLALAGGRMTET